MNNKQAFTLIELLVVVLIIGILAAVALPQYQKAVEKSKGAQALTLLKSVYQAAKAYQLANGSWPSSIDELAVDIPWTGHEKWYETGAYKAPLSNGEWSLQLFSSPDSHGNGVSIGRISGPYQGTAFEIYADRPGDFPTESIFCAEGYSRSYVQHKFSKNKGAYCQQIFRGTEIPNFTGGMNYFLFTN
ncbi:type IV pilin protein [Candidatus Avelusimicrobium caledoniensis]|uniref:type IV pilin protein n=1 Tax=Candidatus Avelusimicrobium caledoniensis TaxID=3416220 RepID=UPI003D0CC98F